VSGFNDERSKTLERSASADSVDLAVLKRASDWLQVGRAVTLYTVIQTWGSAPRQVGSLLALRADGGIEGSVFAAA